MKVHATGAVAMSFAACYSGVMVCFGSADVWLPLASGVDALVLRNKTCEPGQVGNGAALSSHLMCRKGAEVELTTKVTLSFYFLNANRVVL